MPEINKEIMKNVISTLADKMQEEKQEELKEIIEIFKGLKLKPDHFYLYFMFNLKIVLEEVYGKSYDIVLYYNVFESNIENVIALLGDSTCCADKARYILKRYLEYIAEGTVVDFSKKKKEEFWVPNIGTFEEWMDFVEGIKGLIYGNTNKFLISYKNLLKYKMK